MKAVGKVYAAGGSVILTIDSNLVKALGIVPGDLVEYDVEKVKERRG